MFVLLDEGHRGSAREAAADASSAFPLRASHEGQDQAVSAPALPLLPLVVGVVAVTRPMSQTSKDDEGRSWLSPQRWLEALPGVSSGSDEDDVGEDETDEDETGTPSTGRSAVAARAAEHSDGPRSASGTVREPVGGTTTVSERAVSKIAGAAARDVDGVAGIGGRSPRLPGTDPALDGVSAEVGRTQTAIDLTVSVRYPAVITEVARTMRRSVTQRVQRMTGLQVVEVNVDVVDLEGPAAQAAQGDGAPGG